MAYLRAVHCAATPEELFRLLWQPPQELDYQRFLTSLEEIGARIHNGFVVFGEKDRGYAEERRRATVPTEMMLRRARRAVSLVAWVPFVEAVFICNSVGSETARPDSDIDWLVVTKPGRIWLVRAMLNVVLRAAGLRTYGNHEAGKMCLSFFIDSAHMDLSPLRVAPDDVHFAYWLHQMVPIRDSRGRWADFIRANAWASDYVPGLARYKACSDAKNTKESQFCVAVREIFERLLSGKIGAYAERLAERFQRARLKPSLIEKSQRGDNGVVIEEGVLKFHERDTRRALREAWLKELEVML